MICVSPTKKYIAETIKCLQFGSQARQIAKKPSVRSLKKQQQGDHVIYLLVVANTSHIAGYHI